MNDQREDESEHFSTPLTEEIKELVANRPKGVSEKVWLALCHIAYQADYYCTTVPVFTGKMLFEARQQLADALKVQEHDLAAEAFLDRLRALGEGL